MRRAIVGMISLSVVVLTAQSAWGAALVTNNHFSPSESDSRSNLPVTMAGDQNPQAFGYDNSATDNVLYTVQIADASGAEGRGDLIVTKINNSDPSQIYGSMKLYNYGQPVAIGVEHFEGSAATPRNAYLWIETAAAAPDSAGRAFGTKVARIVFHSGYTSTYKAGVITLKDGDGKVVNTSVPFDLARNGEVIQHLSVNIDAANRRLVSRMQIGGQFEFRVYDLDQAIQGNFTNLVPNPPLYAPNMDSDGATFQGYAMYGNWIYTLKGDGGSASTNTRITAFNIIDPSWKYTALTPLTETSVGSGAVAEGMAVRTLSDGRIRLRWGLGVSGSKLAIYEKATLTDDDSTPLTPTGMSIAGAVSTSPIVTTSADNNLGVIPILIPGNECEQTTGCLHAEFTVTRDADKVVVMRAAPSSNVRSNESETSTVAINGLRNGTYTVDVRAVRVMSGSQAPRYSPFAHFAFKVDLPPQPPKWNWVLPSPWTENSTTFPMNRPLQLHVAPNPVDVNADGSTDIKSYCVYDNLTQRGCYVPDAAGLINVGSFTGGSHPVTVAATDNYSTGTAQPDPAGSRTFSF